MIKSHLICRSSNQWSTVVSVTLFAILFVASISYASNRFSLLSLPSSPWPWRLMTTTSYSSSSSSSTSFSIPSFNLRRPPPPSPSPPLNRRTDLYSMFHCDSDVCKKQNEKKNRVVSKMMEELKQETLLRMKLKKKDKKLEKVEAELGRARFLIRGGAADGGDRSDLNRSSDDTDDYVPHGSIYRNPSMFHRSYLLMEKLFKVYVHEEGEPPLFHTGPTSNIYSMEGVFLNFIENDPHFRISDPDRAHVYFLPFSVAMILDNLFDPIIRDKAVLGRVIGDYVHTVSTRYPYWNRSLGSDHFMLSCHDWVGNYSNPMSKSYATCRDMF